MSKASEALTEIHETINAAKEALAAVPLACQWRVSPEPLADRVAEELQMDGWLSYEQWLEGERPTGGDLWLAATVTVPDEAEGVRLAGSVVAVDVLGWTPFSLYVDGKLLIHGTAAPGAGGPARMPLPEPVVGGHTYRLAVRTVQRPLVSLVTMKVAVAIESLETLDEELDTIQAELKVAEALAVTDKHRDALAAASDAIDLEAINSRDWGSAVASFRAAEQCLSPLSPLAKEHKVYLIGHSHIDMNWMWTWPETVDVVRRDFRSVTALMREFPHLTFTHSQVPTYQVVQQHDPETFEEVKKRIAEGRWEAVPVTWVEGDLNMASGEAIARHFLYAVRWSRTYLGVTPEVIWEPDTFGHPANIPQLAKLAGVERYFHTRCNPALPGRWPIYWWEGMDGSRILATSRAYNGQISASSIEDAMMAHRRLGSRVAFHVHGLGDHGGGPTRANMRTLERLQARPLLPTLECGTMAGYGTEALREGVPIPTFRGESSTVFEGSYTTHADIKQSNREGENGLLTAEALGALAGTDDRSSIGAAWQRVLFNQFHDLLDGSAIEPSYGDCAAQHSEEVKVVYEKATSSAVEVLTGRADTRGEGQAIVVVNPLGFSRTDLVRVAGCGPKLEQPMLKAPDGSTTPGQWSGEELLFVARDVPAFGHVVYHLQDGSPSEDLQVTSEGLDWCVDTPFFRARVHKGSGIIDGLLDKRAGRELVSYGVGKWGTPPEVTRRDLALNVLQLCQEPHHEMSSWLIDSVRSESNFLSGATVSVAERGPVCAVLHVEHRFSNSTIYQDVAFYRDLPRIDCRTQVDWQEVGTRESGVPMLKVAFTARLNRPEATYEIPYGAVSRPADGQEVPALRWADLSEDDGCGISLVNDCKYGYDALGSRLRLTLIRCAYCPDPVSDQGKHTFAYSLLPHVGTWREAQIVQQAAGFNQPLLASVSQPHEGEDGALLARMTVTGLPSVVLSSVKCPEDGEGLIVHMYESAGRSGAAELRTARGLAEAEAVDFLEETRAALPVLDGALRVAFRPWEVKALRIRERAR